MRRFYILTFRNVDGLQNVSDYETGDLSPTVFWGTTPFPGPIPECVKVLVEEGEPSDYLANSIGWEIVSERCLGHIKKLAVKDIQAISLPLYDDKTQRPLRGFYVVNVLRCIDALDKPMETVTTAVLKDARIPADTHLFRVPNHPTLVFVSQTMYDELHTEDLKGFAYIKTTTV